MKRKSNIISALWSIALGVGVGLFASTDLGSKTLDTLLSIAQSQTIGCDIKGNISLNTGELIYHVPGGKYYDATKISPDKGERWFCSEADAQAAGWRRSRQ